MNMVNVIISHQLLPFSMLRIKKKDFNHAHLAATHEIQENLLQATIL